MGDAISGITDAVGLTDTKDAGDQARKASREQAAYQEQALDYLKEREALPQAFREGALTDVGAEYGLTLDEEGNILRDGTGVIDRAKLSPLYAAIMGTRQGGEEAIMRNASMTGGFRSGNMQSNLFDQGQRLEERALLESYNQQMGGLQGLASLPSNANQIAQGTAGIGVTLAQGRVADKQAQIAAENQLMEDITGGAGAIAGFSDIRLKTNIKPLGKRNGHNWYSWDWNSDAEKIGLTGSSEGVMAHEVEEIKPEAVGEKDGYKFVNYEMLGVISAS